MKLIEITLFWNETHYFEEKVRSALEYADLLIIAESAESFSGQIQRPLKTPALIAALPEELRPRVHLAEADLSGMAGRHYYDREIAVREAPLRYLKEKGLAHRGDLILAQDFDEFFDSRHKARLLEWFRLRPWRNWTHLKYQLSYYYLNYKNVFPKNHADWTSAVAFRAKLALDDPAFAADSLRRKKRGPVTLAHVGWHHSYLGGSEFIQEKLRSFAHAADAMVKDLSASEIEERLKRGDDLFGRDLRFQIIDYDAAGGIAALKGRRDLMLPAPAPRKGLPLFFGAMMGAMMGAILSALGALAICERAHADPRNVERTRSFYKRHGLDFFSELISDEIDAAADEKRRAKLELLADDARTRALKQLDALLASARGSPMEGDLLIRRATLLAERARTASFFQNTSAGKSRLRPPRAYWEESNAALLEVERKFPTHPKMDVVLFSIAYNDGEMGGPKIEDAYQHYRKLVSKFPGSALVGDARLAMAEILFDKRKFKDSAGQLKEIVKSDHPRLKNFALYKLAWSYYNLSDLDSAMLSLERVVDGVNNAPGARRARLELRKEALNDLVAFYSEKAGDASENAKNAIAYFDRVGKTPESISSEPHHKEDEARLSEPDELLLRLANTYREQGKHEQALLIAGSLIDRFGKHPAAAALYRLRAESAEKLRKREAVLSELDFFSKTLLRELPAAEGHERSLPTLSTEDMSGYFARFDFREKTLREPKAEWPSPPGGGAAIPERASLYQKNLASIGFSTFKDFTGLFHGEWSKTGNADTARQAVRSYEIAFRTFAEPWRGAALPQIFELAFREAALHYALKNWARAASGFEWLALRAGNAGQKDQDFESAIKSLISSEENALRQLAGKDKTSQEKLLKAYDLFLATHLTKSGAAADRAMTAGVLASSARLAHEMGQTEQGLRRMIAYTIHFPTEKDAIALAKDATSLLEKTARWEELRDYSRRLLGMPAYAQSEMAADLAKSGEYAALKLLERLEEEKDWVRASKEFADFAEKNPKSGFLSQALMKAARAAIETGGAKEAVSRLESAAKAPDARVRTQAWLALEPYYRKAMLWTDLRRSYEELLKLKLDPESEAATRQNVKALADMAPEIFAQQGMGLIDADPGIAKLAREQEKFESSAAVFYKLRFAKNNNDPNGNFKKKADQHQSLLGQLDKTIDRAPKSLRGSAALWGAIVKAELLGEFSETLETAALPDVLKKASDADRKAYVETIAANAKELRAQAADNAENAVRLSIEADHPFDLEPRLNKLLGRFGLPDRVAREDFREHLGRRPRVLLAPAEDAAKTRVEIRDLGLKLLEEKGKTAARLLAAEIASKYAALGEPGLAYATASLLREEDKSDDAGRYAGRLQYELDWSRMPLPLQRVLKGQWTPGARWDLARYLSSYSQRCQDQGFKAQECEWFDMSPRFLLRAAKERKAP